MKLAGLKSIENAHEDSVWAATWVPATEDRPSLLLTGSLDETVKLRRADELDLVRTNTGHSLGVAAVAAHPSGIIAASSSLDSFVRVFDVDTNATIAVLEAPPSERRSYRNLECDVIWSEILSRPASDLLMLTYDYSPRTTVINDY
ncbi:hypothetical protein Bca101_007882 [Brassica carinata]